MTEENGRVSINSTYKEWVISNTDNKKEIREEDEPPSNSNNSLYDRICRMVVGSPKGISPDKWREDFNFYSCFGRRRFGMVNTVEFYKCSDISS